MNEFAVAVLVVSPQGVPLVRDPKKPSPIFWKLPGGRGGDGETAPQAAVRELKEETGLVLSEENLEVLHEENRGSHVLVVYKADVSDLKNLKEKGNEGEEIRVFLPREILLMDDFFPNHRRVVQEVLKQ